MSERYRGDVEFIIRMIIDPNEAELDDIDEEYYQFSGGKQMVKEPTVAQKRLYGVLLLLFYNEGWVGDGEVEDYIDDWIKKLEEEK